AVYMADLRVPLSYAGWSLYLLPVAATLFQRRPWMPLAVAAVATLATTSGLFDARAGADLTVAAVNRGIGTFSLWILALVIRQVLVTRGRVDELLWLQRGESEVTHRLLGSATAQDIAERACEALCGFLGAQT